MSLVTWQDLCIDAVDVDVQSQFWAAVSGLEVADVEPPARLEGATRRHTLWVNPVDRPHRVKNRVHLDVDCASVAGPGRASAPPCSSRPRRPASGGP